MIKGAGDFFINESRDFWTKYIATIERKRLGGRRGTGINPEEAFFSGLVLQDEDVFGKRKIFPFSRCV